MVRRVLLVLVLLTVTVAAQQGDPRFRARWGSRVLVGGGAAPRVTITTPFVASAFTVNTSTITLGGTSESTSGAPITAVTWENTTNTTNGSAVGLTEWETAGQSSALTVGLDGFASTASVALAGTNADTTGGAWTNAVNTTAAGHVSRRSLDYIQPNTSITTEVSPRMIDLLTPSPAISGTSYDVSVKLVHDSGVGSDDGAAIVFGYSDSSNYCAVLIYGASAATDVYLLKRVAGVLTVLDSDNVAPAISDVFKVEVRGTELSVKQNGVEVLVKSGDTHCDNAVGVGVGFGAFRDVTTDDATTSSKLDDFTVVDQDGASTALTLNVGANTIIVTATDALANSGTDTVIVTYAVADTVDPVVTISSPTTSPTYATSTTALVVGGDVTDNTAPTSVGLACATCTPTTQTCTLTGSGPAQTFTCGSVNLGSGANTVTLTAADAAANDSTDVLTATYTAGDVTAPVVTITTNSGTNFSTSSGTGTISGTCTDAVGCTQILPSCDVCSTGAVSGTGAWSFTGTWAVGANIVSVGASDEANNLATPDTITVTYTPTPITITTTTLPNGRDDDVYASTTLQSTGGTAPLTWTNNGAGTSLNDSDAHCAGLVISSAGVVSGTPTAAGTCDWTAKVTDNVAATDTQALSIVVVAAGAAGPHDYFTTLIARGDCYLAYSMRPLAGQSSAVTTCAQSRYEKQLLRGGLGGYAVQGSTVPLTLTYCFTGSEPAGSCLVTDTDAQKQDAGKLALPLWISYEGRTLASGINSSVTTIPLSSPQSIVAGAGIKIGTEIMLFPAGVTYTSANPVVQRGAFGTTAAAHSQGAAVSRNVNVNSNQVHLPMTTIGTETAAYLVTWDSYPTDSWIPSKHGLIVHKTIRIDSVQDNWFRADMGYVPYTRDNVAGLFDRTADVGVGRGRRLWGMTFPPSEPEPPQDDHEPMTPWGDHGHASIIKPNTWNRWWVYVETQAEGVAANYTTFTTLNTAISSTSATQITISCAATLFGANCPPVMNSQAIAGGSGSNAWPGRSIKIDNEIMTVTSGVSSGDTATLTVVRGAYSTTPATHSNGANVGLVHDYITMWYADENNNAVELLDRYPAFIAENAAAAARGELTRIRIEVSTSTDTIPQERVNAGQQDLVMYYRNFTVLKNPPADWSSLRVKPVR